MIAVEVVHDKRSGYHQAELVLRIDNDYSRLIWRGPERWYRRFSDTGECDCFACRVAGGIASHDYRPWWKRVGRTSREQAEVDGRAELELRQWLRTRTFRGPQKQATHRRSLMEAAA